jgi:hypothetical protein
MSATLESRIKRIETKAGKGRRLFVTWDGETFKETGNAESDRTFTRAELDAIEAGGVDVDLIRVVHEKKGGDHSE